MHDHSKKQDPSIFCAYAQPLCVVRVKWKKINKIKETMNEQKKLKLKKPKINLRLSHVNHTFFIFEPSNWTPSL
jgi:hypothetical protein